MKPPVVNMKWAVAFCVVFNVVISAGCSRSQLFDDAENSLRHSDLQRALELARRGRAISAYSADPSWDWKFRCVQAEAYNAKNDPRRAAATLADALPGKLTARLGAAVHASVQAQPLAPPGAASGPPGRPEAVLRNAIGTPVWSFSVERTVPRDESGWALMLAGLVGTLAGDDTVFVASESGAAQKKLIEFLEIRMAQNS